MFNIIPHNKLDITRQHKKTKYFQRYNTGMFHQGWKTEYFLSEYRLNKNEIDT